MQYLYYMSLNTYHIVVTYIDIYILTTSHNITRTLSEVHYMQIRTRDMDCILK